MVEPDPAHALQTDLSDVETAVERASGVDTARRDALYRIQAITGLVMGRYVVLEELGRGGMGRVLRAYDPKLEREVALKEVRGGSSGSELVQRLEVEARAMAKLSHPNVVAVYDVELIEGVGPVLVMECVSGQTLSQWLRRASRPWQEIVGRFIAAGRGLAAAHAAGILHRDFKPANVLVGDHGVVKVTDFGLAKGTGDRGSASGVFSGSSSSMTSQELTQAGTVLGTPRYMAPEQQRGEPLTPAVDQYAFCVALWEGLCGQPPFGRENRPERKLEGPPRWPAATVPRPIAEAITRGLHPSPTDRWPSMDALLEALAWDPARRRRQWARVLITLALGLTAGTGWWAWARAQGERCSGAPAQLEGTWDDQRRAEVEAAIMGTEVPYAARAWEQAASALDGYAEQWVAMHTEACEATVRGEQSAALLDRRMGCLRRASVQLRAAVDLLAAADASVVQRAHDVVAGLRPLSVCNDAEALERDDVPPMPADAEVVDQARRLLAEARVLHDAGRFEPARGKIDEARAQLGEVRYGPLEVELALQGGHVLERLGKYDASEAKLREALELGAEHDHHEGMVAAARLLMLVVGFHRLHPDEALRYRELALGLAKGDPRLEASVRHTLGSVAQADGKHDLAEVELRRALALRQESLGPDHPTTALTHGDLAHVFSARGEHAQAEVEHRRALEIQLAKLGPDHPSTGTTRANLSSSLMLQGKEREGEAELREALRVVEQALGSDHPTTSLLRSNLGSVLYELDRPAEAEQLHRRAIAALERSLGPEHVSVGRTFNSLGEDLTAQGRLAEAEDAHRRAIAVLDRGPGSARGDAAIAHILLGELLRRRGAFADAVAELRLALAIREDLLGADHTQVASTRASLAEALLDQGHADQALPLAEQAWERRREGSGTARAEAAFLLARAQWITGSDEATRTRARSLAEQALAELDAGGGGKPDDERHAVQQWLDEHPAP